MKQVLLCVGVFILMAGVWFFPRPVMEFRFLGFSEPLWIGKEN